MQWTAKPQELEEKLHEAEVRSKTEERNQDT
jgi:hypothetical protein